MVLVVALVVGLQAYTTMVLMLTLSFQLKVFKEVSAPVKKKNKKPATLSTVNINPLLDGPRSNLTYGFQRLTAQSIKELKI